MCISGDCPNCAEEIQEAAIKCKHCHSTLNIDEEQQQKGEKKE